MTGFTWGPIARRTAWVLRSPEGQYLLRLYPDEEWTDDPEQAMSWLDSTVASHLLSLALPSAGKLVKMSFMAETTSFPLRWHVITTDSDTVNTRQAFRCAKTATWQSTHLSNEIKLCRSA